MNKFLSLLQATSTPLLADGAMGTLLHARGIPFDQCFDELNLSNPQAVSAIHDEYLEAGAQILLTNTFGANRFKLARHGLQDKLDAINQLGVELARMAQRDPRSWRATWVPWVCALHPLAASSRKRRVPLCRTGGGVEQGRR